MRVGIVGTGGMGNVHARHWHEIADVRIGYRDRNPERAGSFRARWDAESFDSAEDLIEWADIVDICLPTDLHCEYALKAIAAGKAVFLEKPIALTLEDGERIIDAAAKAGVPFMVGQVLRYFPEYALGRRLVQEGVVGRPAAARLRRGGPTPEGASGWFMDHARSGGILVDQAIHDFDWLRWTLGEVSFLYSRSVGAQKGSGPDYALTTLTFESGAVAHVESTWMDPGGFRTTYEVAGSEGLIEFDSRTTAAVRTHLPGDTRLDTALSGSDDPYYAELSAFLQAVRSGTPPPVTGRDGLIALSLSLAARESSQTDRVTRPARV
jgi:predicted dehydrogenase